MDLESNSQATHKTLTTVNYVLNSCYRKKEKAQSTFGATFCVPYGQRDNKKTHSKYTRTVVLSL